MEGPPSPGSGRDRAGATRLRRCVLVHLDRLRQPVQSFKSAPPMKGARRAEHRNNSTGRYSCSERRFDRRIYRLRPARSAVRSQVRDAGLGFYIAVQSQVAAVERRGTRAHIGPPALISRSPPATGTLANSCSVPERRETLSTSSQTAFPQCPEADLQRDRRRAASQPVNAEIATTGTANMLNIMRPKTQRKPVPLFSHMTGNWANVSIAPAIHPRLLKNNPANADRPNDAGYHARQ
jgi:hypothetical protein